MADCDCLYFVIMVSESVLDDITEAAASEIMKSNNTCPTFSFCTLFYYKEKTNFIFPI
jgi:hypothetical protein